MWLVGMVVNMQAYKFPLLILIFIPTLFVFALFGSSIPTFCSLKKKLMPLQLVQTMVPVPVPSWEPSPILLGFRDPRAQIF